MFVTMMFSALGASMAFAIPVVSSDITYFQTEPTHILQADDTGFAARAPPLAVTNVAVTGGGAVMAQYQRSCKNGQTFQSALSV